MCIRDRLKEPVSQVCVKSGSAASVAPAAVSIMTEPAQLSTSPNAEDIMTVPLEKVALFETARCV